MGEYSSLFQDEDEQASGLILRTTSGNPDDAAKARQLAKKYNIPDALVEQFPEEYQRRAEADVSSAALEESKTLQKWISEDPYNAKVSQDDIPNLSMTDKAIRGFGEYVIRPIGGEGYNRFGQAGFGLLAAAVDTLEYIPRKITGHGESALSTVLHGEAAKAGKLADYYTEMGRYENKTVLGQSIASGVSSLWSSLLLAPLGAEIQGQKALTQVAGMAVPSIKSLAPIGAQTAGISYQEASEAGLSVPERLAFAGSQGGVEMFTEALPFGTLLGKARAGSSIVSAIGKVMGQEMVGEQVATHWQDANSWLTLHPEKTLEDYLEERPDAALRTAIATAFSSGLQTGAMHVLMRKSKDDEKADTAQAQEAFITKVNELAQASKIAQRDADTFETFIEKASEDGPVSDVYIDAETFAQSGVADQIMEISSSVADQFHESVANGGTIRIPLSEYVARIATIPELSAPLVEHLKTDPMGFSASEAKTYMKENAAQIEEEVTRALQGNEASSEFKASQEAVRQAVLDNLNQVGRNTPSVNEAYASLIAARTSVRAAQLGMTPEQLFAKQLLRVQGDATQGDAMEQAAFHGSPHQFDRFDLSKMGTGEGNQSFGFGQYFAGEKQVAETYRKGLTLRSPDALQKHAINAGLAPELADAMAQFYAGARSSSFDDFAETMNSKAPGEYIELFRSKYIRPAIADGSAKKAWNSFKEAGQLYAADIPDEAIATMLDWDKPLSEQPHIMAALGIDPAAPSVLPNRLTPEMTGQEVYSALSKGRTNLGVEATQKAASEFLLSKGIPGLRYLDGVSRQKGEGTQNTVVWDQSLLDTISDKLEKLYPQSAKQTKQADTPAFKKWFGESKVVDENGEPLVVYHGTTADFTSFDKQKGNPEADMGAGFYFSNTPEDVANNYAGEGPDLTGKIEQKAERLADEIKDFYDEFPTDKKAVAAIKKKYGKDVYSEDTMEMARNIVRKEFSAHGGLTLPVYLKMENPAVLGGDDETVLTYEQEVDDDGEPTGEESGTMVDVLMALQNMEGEFGDFDYGKFVSDLEFYDGMTVAALYDHFGKSEGVVYATDENGVLASHEIFRRALDEAGFDGIIDHTVDVKFGSQKRVGKPMAGMGYDTAHYIVFEPTQIKSAIGNSGAFDPADPNILHQSAAVDRFQMVADRGERVTGQRAIISPEEKKAIESSAERTGISEKEITRVVREHKMAHPQAQGWAPLVFNRAVIINGKVSYEYKSIPYSFSADAEGKQLDSDAPEYKRRVQSIARGMVDEVRRVFQRSADGDKNAANILAQAGWYKSMRARLRHEFGGLGDLFADLLGATSPNTPVRDNWTNAVDALRRASRGDFDSLITQWEQWADNIDAIETDARAYFNERLAEGLTKKAIKALPEYQAKLEALKAARELSDDLLPTKETGKKYGFNGRNVARAMVDLWRVVKNADPDLGRGGTAPKALNFSGNLIGFRQRATIDVWAARMLQRLAGGKRIPSMAETGVSGEMREDASTTLQFGLGQDVFTDAAKRIRADQELKTDKNLAALGDDDLQAVVWFIEKELWTVNNWTNSAGEGGSFELEASLSGSKDQARIKELRRILDSSKSKPAAKAAARTELADLERTVDRFVGGLSTQMSLGVQGENYVPVNADMARLGNSIRTAIYEADDGATVLASKALPTEGRYGDVERSLDLEVVAREGYNANALWLEMLRQAEEAKQDSTFLSRVLRENEEIDTARHRPGVEIYFREAASREKLEALLAELSKEGVEFLTVVVDGRRLGSAVEGDMPQAVGVRLQYVPEFEQRYGMDDFSQLSDEQIAEKMSQKSEELDNLAERVVASVDGVSFAGKFWYDTQVAFSHQYQEKARAIATGATEGKSQKAGEEGGLFAGQRIREGIESADRQARETASGQPDGDVLGGLPQSSAATLEQSQRGAYSPSQNIVTLLKDADLSTFLHEGAHYFFENDIALANELLAKPERTEGEQAIVDDVSTLLKWHGIEGTADEQVDQWNQLDFEQKRKHHERTAESFEAYLFSGKSPSIELSPYFQKFRQFMLSVYKSLKSFLTNNPEAGKLNDEVRGVFDRMLATDEQIQLAEQARSMLPLFKTAAEAEKFGVDFAKYQELAKDSTEQAIEILQAQGLKDMQWLHNAHGREVDKLKKKSESLRRETRIIVRNEVMSEPVYRAWQFLTSKKGEKQLEADGETVISGKLNIDEIGLMDTPLIARRLADYKMLSKNDEEGISPKIVADMFGFDSAESLTRALYLAPPPFEEIESRTDARMLAEHGNLATPEAITKEADKALYNKARGKMLLADANALEKASSVDVTTTISGKKRTINILPKAAKQYADSLIAKMRVRDIRPAQYEAAEIKAGKATEKAKNKGDLEGAAAQARTRLINFYAARSANEALDEVDAAIKYLKKVQEPGKLPAGHHEQIVAILSKFSLRSESNKALDNIARFGTWARAQLEAGNIPPNVELLLTKQQRIQYARELSATNNDGELIYADEEKQIELLSSMLDETPVRNYREITMEELRGLVDTVKQIDHMGRLTKKVLTDRKNREFADVVKTITDNLVAVAIGKGRKSTDTYTPTDSIAKKLLSWRGFWGSHIKTATQVHIMDGRDGGPMWEHLVQTANEAGNGEVVDGAAAYEAVQALLKPVKAQGAITGKSEPFPTIGRSLNRQERLVMALNLGNESNEQRLLGGNAWTRAQIQPVLDTLTRADWTFVQGMWDLFDSYRPRVDAMKREIEGVGLEPIPPRPFQVKLSDGSTMEMRGGYAPVIFDPRSSGKAASFAAEKEAKAMMQAARVAATVNKSFTKARVTEVKGRPLLLSLDAMIGGIQDTIHYLHWQPWIIDANRLVKALDAPMREHYGAETVSQIRAWVGDNAAGVRPSRDGAERAITNLARNVSFAGLAFNFFSAVQQVTGYSQSVAVVGSKWMFQGVAKTLQNPKAAYTESADKSAFMRKRGITRMRDLAETHTVVRDQGALRTAMDTGGYAMMLAMQSAVDVPTWWGAYHKALDSGHDEQDSINLADQAVITSQGSGMAKDLAMIERANGALRLLTGFMAFMNTTLNLNYRILKGDQTIASKATDLVLVNTIPVVLTMLLKAALFGDDDEDKDAEELAKAYAAEQVSFLLGQMIAFREVSQVGAAAMGLPTYGYQGAVGTRMFADTMTLAKQVGQGEMDDALRKALVNAAGDFLRLPSTQINRTISGAEALAEDETDNPTSLAFGYRK